MLCPFRCNDYQHIIERYHSTSAILICTEAHGLANGKAGGNPVVAALLKWRPSILFPKGDLAQDAATILGARHIILSTSTFSKVSSDQPPNQMPAAAPCALRTTPCPREKFHTRVNVWSCTVG